MKDRDCESCKKFSRTDPYESEGYCEAKRIWVDPQEGEDCKMHEFTLWTANKYKDGTPIMSEPKPESNQLDSLEQRVDELSEEYDAVLKTHGDTLEQHTERITINEGNIDALCCEMEDLQRKVYQIYQFLDSVDPDFFAKIQDEMVHNGSNFCGNCTHCDQGKINAHEDMLDEHLDRICELEHMYESILDDICVMRDRLCKITDLLVGQDEYSHIFNNFCGNCVHAEMKDGLCTCALTGEALDPDYASCSRFDPSFAHMNDRPDWMEKIRKDLTTPSEPTEGCKDCKCAVDGMCVKYNCSLGAICATPECHEPAPF